MRTIRTRTIRQELAAGIVVGLSLLAGAETYHATEGTLVVGDSTLSAYYPFDAADALSTDRSPCTNGALTVSGTPSFVAAGKIGGCCQFGGKGYFYGSQPASIPIGANPVSVCLWVKAATYNSNRAMVGYGDTSSFQSLCEVAVFGDGTSATRAMQNYCQNAGWEGGFTGTLPGGAVFNDGWHSVVFTYDGLNRNFFLDGELVASARPAFTWGNFTPAVGTGTLNIGIGVNGGFNHNKFEGSLDEVAIFNRAFTAADAAGYHASGVKGVTTAIADGSTFMADAGCTLDLRQDRTVADTVSGAGIVKAGRLTVTNAVGGGITVEGTLTLAEGVTIDASAPFVVTGALTIEGGATVMVPSIPTELPASVQVAHAASIVGGESVSDWRVADLPQGVSAVFSVSPGRIDVAFVTSGSSVKIYHAAAGTTYGAADSSLAVYYPFDAADTLSTDCSPCTNGALTVSGTPSFVATGKIGGCCQFGGNGYFYGSQPASIPIGANPVSVCLWVKAATYNCNRAMVGYGTMDNDQSLNEVTVSGDGSAASRVTQNYCRYGWLETPFTGTLPGGALFNDGWHSVVFTYDGKYRTFFLDGELVASAQPAFGSGIFTPDVRKGTLNIGIGVNGGFNHYKFQGSLDEVAIFNRAFTAADAAGYHASGVKGVTTAIADGSILMVEPDGRLEINQYGALSASEVQGGAGTIAATHLTVTKSLETGVAVEGDLTLASGVCLKAKGYTTVSGSVNVEAGGSIAIPSVPSALPAVIPVISATSVTGAENIGDWTVTGVPDGMTAKISVNDTMIAVCVFSEAIAGNAYYADAGTFSVCDATLAAYYPMDDASALGEDRSGHANAPLNVVGSGTTVLGRFGKAISCGGESYLVSAGDAFPSSVPSGAKPFTVCCFAKSTSQYMANRGLVAWGACDFAKLNEICGQESDVKTVWHMFAPQTWDRSGIAQLPSGTFQDGWHSIVVTFDGKYRAIYMDGQEVLEPTQPRGYGYTSDTFLPNVTATNFTIGASIAFGHGFFGYIDEVAVFDRALTAMEACDYHEEGVHCSTKGIPSDSAFVVADGATLKLSETTEAAALYGSGTIVCASPLTVRRTLGAGVAVTGDITLADGAQLTVGTSPTVVSGRVTLSGVGGIAGVESLENGHYVLLEAASFGGTEHLKNWRAVLSGERVVRYSVSGNTLVADLEWRRGMVIIVR